jgi:hypothetical protein
MKMNKKRAVERKRKTTATTASTALSVARSKVVKP